MSGESGELADNISQAPIGDALQLIRHRELERAAAHRDRDDQPLRQWHPGLELPHQALLTSSDLEGIHLVNLEFDN